MAANKKSLLASLIKELVGTKTAQSSKENDEKKKKLVAETIKETASTSGGNGDNAAIMKILNMLETQLNVKTSALEEEASKRRDAELEVQKLRQDLIKLENEQKLDDNSKTLATIHTLIDAMASEDDDNKGKSKKKNFKVEGKQNFQQGSRGNKGNGGYSGPNKSNTTEKNNDGNQSGSKPNFGGNLNTPDQSKKNKCQNKKFDQQNYPHPNKNFNQVRNTIPPLLNQPHFNQSNNINQPPGNQGPMNNFNPTTNANPLLGNVIQHPPHFNPPQFNSYHNQNPYPQQPNNFVPYTQPIPNIPPGGLHQFGSFPNQGRNVQQPYQQQGVQQPYHQQGRNFRGRGGNFTRGRGNFRGNARGGVNIGKQFGGNNSSVKGGAQEKDGFVFVSKSDISSNAKNPDTNITSNHVVNDGHEQNNQLQKTNFKKKRNRKNRAERQNKDEKEKDEDFDSESVMQGMMDVFSKMFGNVVAQQQQSTKTKNDEPQQPIQSKNVEPQLPPSNPKDVEPQSPKSVTSTVNTGPNQQTGAIKKDVIPGKTRNKANKQKEGNQQIKDIKETKTNPLKLFVGSGFPSEEEAKDKNINLNQEVKDLIMVAKFEGNSITEQPKTLRDMTNFKKKYPNASAIVIKDEQ